jgi:hypothetical protein
MICLLFAFKFTPMRKLVYLFLASAFAVSCGSSEEKTDNKKTDKKEEAKVEATEEKPDTLYLNADYKNPYNGLSESDKKLFKQMLGDSLTAQMMILNKSFDSVSTHRQMFIYYRELNRFGHEASIHLSDLNVSEEFHNMIVAEKEKKNETVEEYEQYSLALDYILEKLKPINNYLQGLKLECMAECTEPHLDLYLNELKDKVKETEGEDDDQFFGFMLTYFDGEFEPDIMSVSWFEPTWDLGGMSLLGSGVHTQFLQETDKMLEAKNMFSESIKKYRGYCIDDASNWMSFAFDKEKVLKELKTILKKVKLSSNEKDNIRNQIKVIEENTEEGYQFECKTKECSWG